MYIVVAVIGTATFPLWYPHTPRGRQLREIKASDDFLATKLRPLITSDIRFAKITLGTGTSVTIFVHGEVATDEDLDALREIVTNAKPPVPVLFPVRVTAP